MSAETVHIRVVGVNHRSAPVAVREQLALDGAATATALAAFRQRWPLAEALVLSTCNRVELYAAAEGDQPDARALAEFLADCRGLTADRFAEGLYDHADREAARHLFRVVSGLDSQVLGESQVAGQVKGAYARAAEAGATGVVLHRLFQRSFKVAKTVRTTTEIARHPVSVASVAAAFAARVFEGLDGKVVLVIGAGETAELTLRHLQTLGAGGVVVANRTLERGQALAARHGGAAVPFETLPDALTKADIVISATSAPTPVLTAAAMGEVVRRRRRRRRRGPLFILDIAVPRDVEPAVSELDDVYLYTIDDLQQVADENRRKRSQDLEAGLAQVEREADAFLAWLRSLEAGPVIRALRRRLHDLGRHEVERLLEHLEGLSGRDRRLIELMERRLVNRLLHQPMTALRRALGRGRGSAYLGLVRELFGLEDERREPPTT